MYTYWVVGLTPTGSHAYWGHLGKLFEGVKAELVALGSMIASVVVLDQREHPWFHRQEFLDGQSGSSRMDSSLLALFRTIFSESASETAFEKRLFFCISNLEFCSNCEFPSGNGKTGDQTPRGEAVWATGS